MAGGLVAVGVILVVTAVGAGMLYLLLHVCPEDETIRQQGFYTILPYHTADPAFAQHLTAVLRQVRWMDAALLERIYVVNWDVPEAQTKAVQEICAAYEDVMYCSRAEFLELMEKQFGKGIAICAEREYNKKE